LTKARTDMTFFVNVLRKEKNMDCLIDPIPLIF